jgi:glycogen debranching enzyme/short-subunit dehydrogenase
VNKRPKVVVITGASAGVGRATAIAFAKSGALIGLIARGRERLEAARRDVEAAGGRALVLPADVADARQVEAAADIVEREFGPIGIWVNNAMATIFAPFQEISPEEFERATKVTYLGYVYGTMAALSRMRPRDCGVIVQVGSALAHRSIPLQSAYCGAKHAIIGFTDSLRSELIHDCSNVHITVVNMPALNTPQFEWSRTRLPRHPQPVPPIFQPEVAAQAIVWAAHQRRREIDVGFPTVLATNGQKIAPGLGDRYLARSAYESQQTPDPVSSARPDNLFEPAAGEYSAHGTFDSQAHGASVQFWMNRNRSKLGVAAGLIGFAVAAATRRKANRNSQRQRSFESGSSVPSRTRGSGVRLAVAAGGFLAFALAMGNQRSGSGNRNRTTRRLDTDELPVIAENRTQVYYAWRGPASIIVDTEGWVGGPADSGVYFRHTRYLRELRLELFGEPCYPCSASEIAPNQLEFTYVYPEKKSGGSDRGGQQHGVQYRDLDLRLTYTVVPNGVDARLRLTNRWMQMAHIRIAWRISADFADYDEVFGDRKQNAAIATEPLDSGIRFRYLHPELPLETSVRVQGPGEWAFTDGRLAAELDVERQCELEWILQIRAIDGQYPISDEGARMREARLHRWKRSVTQIEAPGDAPIAMITNRCLQDVGSMALLEGPPDEWLAPAAGIPVYQSLWGRDAMTAVWQSSVFDRGEMADAVLTAVGRLQGDHDDPSRDEQPGRTIRGTQRSPLARLNLTPFGRYYGDYAGPFDFIFALGQLFAWSGDGQLLRKHWDAARRIIDWARDRGDIDRDGYLEYKTLSPGGPKHQGWRDAENAVVYADGTQVDPPIATCEVQGYWFAAQQIMAVFSAILGNRADAVAHWKNAQDLKQRFNRDFWMPHERCVALGLDMNKRQIDSVTSNAGQTLTTGIVSHDHLPMLADRLFEPDMFSGWGVRTLSKKNPAYNPLSYHLGSVWPVENGTLLFGLRRFGFERHAAQLARALYELALIWRTHRVPECVGGYARNESLHPGAYPRANAPQTWNQSVFPILIQTLLGIWPVGSLNLLAVYPALPDWVPELIVRNLRVSAASVSLHFRRDETGATRYEVLEKQGNLHIIHQPPPDSLTAGIWDRLGALADGLLPA